MIHYEDLVVGETEEFGAYEVTREEVIEFASKYDPQPFHLDDEAAAATHFGRLSASGWHTAAMTMRMMVDNFSKKQRASLGSPGIDELRWLKPVYPGDTLSVTSELIEKRRSKSRPEMGIMRAKSTTWNQHGEAVMTLVSNGLIKVRDPDAPID
ncbi:MaoC family dehydratase [Alteriqipengyuania flavescens]|uniref:MaoC family dehydratase n=1 Tax=Alteriqipengyuania flavescens TaxID=3053610 RepID=UPI0025B2B0C9|nr:MaoC family dehydratase [Alteriqipengyuania flavescens]WJY18309.1 MaoC family dehydratase [Alteriqipengyuania flavescens]WJY24250.1 MaoC family dehydratase [Alteriqipengyuania flavescens]